MTMICLVLSLLPLRHSSDMGTKCILHQLPIQQQWRSRRRHDDSIQFWSAAWQSLSNHCPIFIEYLNTASGGMVLYSIRPTATCGSVIQRMGNYLWFSHCSALITRNCFVVNKQLAIIKLRRAEQFRATGNRRGERPVRQINGGSISTLYIDCVFGVHSFVQGRYLLYSCTRWNIIMFTHHQRRIELDRSSSSSRAVDNWLRPHWMGALSLAL